MLDLQNYAKNIEELIELIEMDIEDEEEIWLIKSHFEQAKRACEDALNHIWVMEQED